jgi:hypothetical protein
MRMSILNAVLMSESVSGIETPVESFDFEVDGVSLADLLAIERNTMVGRFKAAHPERNQAARLVFLLKAPADLATRRVMLFGCPCGDVHCGAITIAVRREGNFYEWDDFRYENGYAEEATQRFGGVGPFRFRVAEYKRVLLSLCESPGAGPSTSTDHSRD